MAKGRQRGKSVGGQEHLWFEPCKKVLAPVSKLDLGIDWPVSSLINLERPGWYYCPRGAQGRCQVCEPTHGFKPGVAVKKTQESECLVL